MKRYKTYNTRELLNIKSTKSECCCPICKRKHSSEYIICQECQDLLFFLCQLYSVEDNCISLDVVKQLYDEYSSMDKVTLQTLINNNSNYFKTRFLIEEKIRKGPPIRTLSSNQHICIRCKQIFADKTIDKDNIFAVCRNCSTRKGHKSYGVRNTAKVKLTKSDKVPFYVNKLMSKCTDKLFLNAEGDILNPKITYKCLKCKRIIIQTYDDIQKGLGHNCPELDSKGESLFEEYLIEKNMQYHREFKTLKCINPETGRILPYDFELINENCIVEIHGRQHYVYIPYFHKTREEFIKRQEIDRFKKDFALSKGYKYIEINAEIFDKQDYKTKIDKKIEEIL